MLCTPDERLRTWIRVASGTWTSVHLESRSAVAGLCVVLWARGHAATPTELSDEAAHGYWGEVLDVGRALEQVFRPVAVNYLTMGNAVPHLHTVVLPRHLDDPAPGHPLPWDQLYLDAPTDEAIWHRHAAELRAALPWPAQTA